jgi:nucleotide-binding universal stress UspA family protein
MDDEVMNSIFEKPFKSIIVGVDFSSYSKIVVKQAQLLSELWKARLVLVYAFQMPPDYYASPFPPDPILTDAKSNVARVKKFYKVTDPEIKIIADDKAPLYLINKTADKFPHPLIMVGYKGQSPIGEFFFGSTAQTLALKATAPIWIHRGNKVIKPLRLLIPHDLSATANSSIEVAKRLSLSNPLTYEVFYVNQKPFPILDYKNFNKLNQKSINKTQAKVHNLTKAYPNIRLVSESGDVTEKVVKRSEKFDVIVMSHHPKGFFEKSETMAVMRKVSTPLIIAH